MPAKKTDQKKGTRKRATGYVEQYRFYADVFGESERTIKRWVRTGKEVDDLPPLDAPEQMANWWSRHYKNRVPVKILQLAKSVPANGDEVVKDDPLFTQPVEKAAPAPIDLEVGLEASVDRLRRAEAVANHKFTEAIRLDADEGEIERKQRAWERVAKQLSISEKSLRDMESKYGALYGADEIKRELVKIHGSVYAGVKNFMRRVMPKAELIEDPIERNEFYEAETNKLFRHFGESAFGVMEEPG